MAVRRPLLLLSGLGPGGAESVTAAFAARLRAAGGRPLVCTVTGRHDGAPAAELAASGVERRDLEARRLADPRLLRRYARTLDREGVDLVHAHGQDASILAAVLRSLHALRPGRPAVPLVLTRHVLEEPGDTRREALRARLSLWAVRRADAVVAVSETVAGRLHDAAGIDRGRVHVIANGVPLEAFSGVRPADARRDLLSELGLEDPVRLVLLPAVLRSGKGHDTVLDALPLLRRACPGARVLFAGGGPLERELREHARRCGEDVLVLGHRSDLPRLLVACDLVVLPSRAEGLPTVLIEAAAAGRPVVASRVGGVPEVVEDGTTGDLVAPGDPAGLAAAVAALLRDRARADRYGTAARRLAARRFSIDGQVRRTLDLWRELVAR